MTAATNTTTNAPPKATKKLQRRLQGGFAFFTVAVTSGRAMASATPGLTASAIGTGFDVSHLLTSTVISECDAPSIPPSLTSIQESASASGCTPIRSVV